MKMDEAIEIKKGSDCPNCGEHLDACSGVEAHGKAPSPGDITVCLYCGHLMAFTDILGLRVLTEAELNEVSDDPRIMAIQAARKDIGL